VNQLLLQYSYLQMLDLLTTMAFMLHGIEEANRSALRPSILLHPLGGLLAPKMMALASNLLLALRTRAAADAHQRPVCDRGGLEPGGADRGRHGRRSKRAANGYCKVSQPIFIRPHVSVRRRTSSSR
jgi:hypothetical protein